MTTKNKSLKKASLVDLSPAVETKLNASPRMLRETGAGFRVRYAQVMNQCSGISTFNKK